MSETTRFVLACFTGSRNYQWTAYDSQALLIAVRDIVDKTRSNLSLYTEAQQAQTPKYLLTTPPISRLRSIEPARQSCWPHPHKQMLSLEPISAFAFLITQYTDPGRHMELHRPRATGRDTCPCCVEPASMGIQPRSSWHTEPIEHRSIHPRYINKEGPSHHGKKRKNRANYLCPRDAHDHRADEPAFDLMSEARDITSMSWSATTESLPTLTSTVLT